MHLISDHALLWTKYKNKYKIPMNLNIILPRKLSHAFQPNCVVNCLYSGYILKHMTEQSAHSLNRWRLQSKTAAEDVSIDLI